MIRNARKDLNYFHKFLDYPIIFLTLLDFICSLLSHFHFFYPLPPLFPLPPLLPLPHPHSLHLNSNQTHYNIYHFHSNFHHPHHSYHHRHHPHPQMIIRHNDNYTSNHFLSYASLIHNHLFLNP